MVSVKDGFIETDLYTKPTDKTPVSSHFILLPHHTKRSVRYSLALRHRRICSGHDSYIQRTNELINYLNNRGHDKALLTRQIQRTSDDVALRTHECKTEAGVLCRPESNNISRIKPPVIAKKKSL